jgi:phosphopantetheinyl transferase
MPLYRKTVFDDGMVLTIWKIEEAESELRSLLSLNAKEVRELESIKAPQSRLRWMASRLALKSVFEEWKVIQIHKDVHGKPYFELLNGHFSLSHSGEFAVCAYHPEKMVGVDIEFIRPKVFDIRKKFMKADELNSIPEKNAMESLFVCWCAKEAIYKWQGKKGLSMKDGINVHPFVYQEKGQLTAELMNDEGTRLLEVHYERLGDFMMAYVSPV